MKTKKCFKCFRELTLDEFYRHPAMDDGDLNKCKECSKSDTKKHRALHIEHFKAYDRDRFQNDPERRALQIEQMKRWAQNNKQKYLGMPKQWQARNPEKRECHIAIQLAIASGAIVKSKSCQDCGATDVRIHGHHPDYNKPLDVIWLCVPCHARLHRLEREVLRKQASVGG